jgi:hypothetical protein
MKMLYKEISAVRARRTQMNNTTAALLLGLLLSSFAFAQKPDWVTVSSLMEANIKEDDLTYLGHALNRCAALNMSLSRITVSSSPERAASLDQIALSDLQASIFVSVIIQRQRSEIEPVMEQHSERAQKAIVTFYDMYNNWLDDNYIKTGSYFIEDQSFTEEMNECNSVVDVVAQELIK